MECWAIPANVIASCFALVSFIAALAVGWASENTAPTILWRAIVVMGVCWIIGRLAGGIALRAIEENLSRYRSDHPIPDDEPSASADAAETAAEPGV